MTKKKSTGKELQLYNNNTAVDIKKAAWSSLSEESQKSYQSDYNIFFEFIKKDIKKITASDILAYIDDLKSKGYKNSSINRKVASLSKMFKVSVLAGDIRVNPVEVLKGFKNISMKTSKDIKISLSIKDIEKATNLGEKPFLWEKKICMIVRMLAKSGLRISELINIQNRDIEDYNKSNKIIRIVGKGQKERFIFVEKKFLKEIKKLFPDIPQLDFLFYSLNTKKNNIPIQCHRVSLHRDIGQFFMQRIGKKVHPHMLRHFYTTYKISVEKQDIKAVSRYIGHQDVSTTLNMYVDKALDFNDAKIKI